MAITDAHKPITSKYTYHQDVYPIFLNQCGGCHSADAVAPMSLLTYEDAYPWAQSIKEEVVNLTMPPWQAEYGFGACPNTVGSLPEYGWHFFFATFVVFFFATFVVIFLPLGSARMGAM
ncbi:MAG: hypothetical protein VX992_05645, partial [Acidobacteriota bacterium]|nr:hypothetical protein [Acidobacteriota bacterium]